MTTNPPEDEARDDSPATSEEYKAASSYAASGNRGKDMPSYGIRIKAHVSGQRVGDKLGYARALEEVEKACKHEFDLPGCFPDLWENFYELLEYLKSTHTKGGA